MVIIVLSVSHIARYNVFKQGKKSANSHEASVIFCYLTSQHKCNPLHLGIG